MFSKSDIEQYMSLKCYALSKKSYNWINKILNDFYSFSQGSIQKLKLIDYAQHLFIKYPAYPTRHKHFVYIRNFITHLSKTRDEPFISSLLVYFEMPKVRREMKLLTSRIIIQDDICNVLRVVQLSSLQIQTKQNYACAILFLAYSGQRVITGCRITVQQIRDALNQSPPVLTIQPRQDKLRFEHYVPLHPATIPYLIQVIGGKSSNECLFSYEGLKQWLSRNPVPLSHTNGDFTIKGFQKVL